MALMEILTFLSIVTTALANCVVHDEDHFYYNISDLGLAAFDNRVDDVDDLLAGGCEVNYNGTAVLMEYSYSENDYEYGDYEDSYGEYGDATVVVAGMTALHIAATEGNNDMAAKLLTVPDIEVDIETTAGATPLFDASTWGFTKIMEMLVAAGADINHQDINGWTPLHTASAYGELHAAKLLVQLGADLNIPGISEEDTPVMVAAAFGFPDVVQLLVRSGADLHLRDIYNMTALDWALDIEDKEIEQILRHGEEFYVAKATTSTALKASLAEPEYEPESEPESDYEYEPEYEPDYEPEPESEPAPQGKGNYNHNTVGDQAETYKHDATGDSALPYEKDENGW